MKRRIYILCLKYFVIIYLILCAVVFAGVMPPGSTSKIIEQLIETFEFMYSPFPFINNAFVLVDAGMMVIEQQMLAIFVTLLIPSYVISYILFLRRDSH